MESETTIRVDSVEWPFDVRPLTPKLGVEIIGVDLGAPMGDAQEGLKKYVLKEDRGELFVGLEG